MIALGVAARFAQLVAGLGLVGIWSAMLLAGPSERPTALAWTARMVRLARWLVAAALFAGVATLAHQAAVATGRGDALLSPSAWLRLLGQSRFGTVWIVRHGLLLLILGLVLLREREGSRADFVVWRAEGWVLGAAALAAMAWAGHAAAVDSLGDPALLADAVHLVAAGTWFGALLPLALLLRRAATESGAEARPWAVLAIRRFSVLSFFVVLLVVATGIWNAWLEVASVPALLGTPYGRLLLVKMALLVPVLGAAAFNRRRLLPALSGDGATVGRPAMARLARLMAGELALAVAIVGVTAGLSLTAPARHETPDWPFATRLSYAAAAGFPGLRARLFIGAQLAVLGLLTVVVGTLVASRRGLLVGGGALAVVAGAWIALPPLVVDAYPTTYLPSAVPYQATSITRGIALYADHCALCHGVGAKGDGAGGAGLPRPPADLTGLHTGQHTAGDLFWWISHGIPRSGMPAFSAMLSGDERWDLVNFLRALAAGETARALIPRVEPDRAWLVAPDFSFAVGPAPTRTLRGFRDHLLVHLVLFSLPESRPRLAELARASTDPDFSGLEVIAIPMREEPRMIGRLGDHPPILYPVVTEGGSEIVSTYLLFARGRGADKRPAPPHVEYLIDRRGYIRARWQLGDGDTGSDPLASLREAIRILDREALTAPPAEEHVH